MKDSKNKIMIVGGPIEQMIDDVLKLSPTGKGNLATSIAECFEQRFESVARVGNFDGSRFKTFLELQTLFSKPLDARVIIFLAHLPNVLVQKQDSKIRLTEKEVGEIKIVGAPKLIQEVKTNNPKTILIPFKLALPDDTKVTLIRWMLKFHFGLIVYSRLGQSGKYYLLDVLGNEVEVNKNNLPVVLREKVEKLLQVIRRSSIKVSEKVPEVPYVQAFVDFSRKMQPAFSQLIERNVATDRFPGNFSFRCTHGFFSKKVDASGFVVTRRNVAKTGLTDRDFVYVYSGLVDNKLQFAGFGNIKPSTDAPLHRIIYNHLPWVKCIVHGHMTVRGTFVNNKDLSYWPCGAENQAYDLIGLAPTDYQKLWAINVEGHGFIALIGDDNPEESLNDLSNLNFTL